MAAEIKWQLKYKPEGAAEEKDYEFGQSDLRIGLLRQFKEFFGKEYGKISTFIELVIDGDGDALACLLYGALKKAGETPPDPRNALDFSVGDMFYDLRRLDVEARLAELARIAAGDEEPEADPQTGDTAPPTSD